MKFRFGFISNSSSCSFCIGKVYMTKEQIDKFSEWSSDFKTDDGWASIYETPYYFHGEVGQHSYEEVRDKLVLLGVSKEYIAFIHG